MNFRSVYFLRRLPVLVLTLLLLAGCMKDDAWVMAHRQQETFSLASGGLFVVNEGNFMYGNATLSYYDTLKRTVVNDLFYQANGLPLGDVAQSMRIRNNAGYIVVNNSGKIYVIDKTTGRYTAKITGLTSPRYIHFISDSKAYVTDLYAVKITVINPLTGTITGSIPTPGHPSTEEMVVAGGLLFVSCWSGDKTVLAIDPATDKIVAEIATGDQPCGLVSDRLGRVWVLCQSYPGNASGSLARLQRIDPQTRRVDLDLEFPAGAKPVKLTVDGKGDNLYWLLGTEVRKMAVTERKLPSYPYITINYSLLYGLGIEPVNGDIYASDAIDYQQPGWVYRFSATGFLKDKFKAGIIPGSFCFR